MTEKTVSVIIPNYNHAHFLKNAVHAYLEQTYQPLEIIIVDDGSQDNSVDIIKDMAGRHSLIRHIQLETNLGVNEAIMKGLRAARGEYVVFTAADDTVEKTFLEKSINILKQHPHAGFSFCDPSVLVSAENKSYHYPLLLSEKPTYLSPNLLLIILKRYLFTFPSNSAVFNRELLIKSGGFITTLGLGADWFACFVCAFRHGVCYIPEPLTLATVRSDSLSAQGLHDGAQQQKTFFKILDLLNSTSADVMLYFKNSAVVYECSWRAFFWLLSSPRYYSYFSFLLVKRLMIRGAWNYLRSKFSPRQRNLFRKLTIQYKIKI